MSAFLFVEIVFFKTCYKHVVADRKLMWRMWVQYVVFKSYIFKFIVTMQGEPSFN